MNQKLLFRLTAVSIAVVFWFIFAQVVIKQPSNIESIRNIYEVTCHTITDIYEDTDGLHVILAGDGVEISNNSDILIELEDEKEVYYFDLKGKPEEIRYFREGNEKEGTTGVFVVLREQVYSIDSPFLN